MADLKISQLTGATTPLGGTEEVPLVQSGTTKKVTAANLTAGRSVSMLSVTLTGGTANGVAYLNSSQQVVTDPTKLYFDGTNFGIGRTPSAKLDVEGSAIVRGTITPTDAIRMGGNTSTPSGADAFIYRPTDNTLGLGTGSTDRFWIDPNGDMLVRGAGRGINFTANTPAAGMTSQLLNWYEEGTWTPTSVGGMTGFANPEGTFTRVGRMVNVRGSFDIASITNNVFVGGLPFTSAATVFYSVIDHNFPVAVAFKRIEASGTQIQWNVNATGAFAVTISFTAWYFAA